MSTPPSPHEGTPAGQPRPNTPPDTPDTPDAPNAPNAPDTPDATDAPDTPAAGPAPAPGTPAAEAAPTAQPVAGRGRRFLGWARTPLGVGVLVAAAMLVFLVLPLGAFAFSHGDEGGRGERGGYGREFGDRHGERHGGRDGG
ncbi:MAG: hypothetical protein JWN54_1964, partial [Mycobacterium sp.]|nr:hypothetical protein [Mycobacterium sp.]